MIKVLEKLQKLQVIENSLRKVENSKEGLPKLIIELETEFNEKKLDLTNCESEYNLFQENLKTNRETIVESKDYLDKYKEKRNNVTNNKEYEAINTEMKYRENLIIECEENINSLEKDVEKKKEDVDAKKVIVDEVEKKLDSNKQLLSEKVVATEQEEKHLISIREKLIPEVPERYLRMFKKISGSKDGLAIAYGDRGHCGGCRSILPSQKVSELKRRSSIVQCDACSRILTWGFIDKDLLNQQEELEKG
jgi:predicted  nucleic acid-binding Zn-ribbon protein